MLKKSLQQLNQGLLSDAGLTDINLILLESNPDCMKVLDNEGRVIYLNANGFCQLEFDDSFQVHGKHWWELWQIENKTAIKDAVSRALKGEEVHFTEFCPTAKGTPKWWDIRVSPITKDDGVIDMVLSVSRDVTEQMRIAQELQSTGEKLKTGIKVADVALAQIDYLNQEVTLTQECAVLYGFPEDTLIINLSELYATFHPDYVERLMAKSAEAKRGMHQGLLSVEHPIILPDKSERWLRVNKQFFFEEIDGENTPVRAVLSVQNITSQHEANAKILESEKRFRSLAENSPTWIWLVGTELELEYANARLYEYVGKPHTDERLTSFDWRDYSHPDDHGKIDKYICSSGAKAESFEIRIKEAASDNYYWFLFNVVPRAFDGSFQGFICSGMNIHDQKLSELKKDEFIGIASHEMKTPLTVAKAYIQMLELELDGTKSDALTYAQKAANSLDRLHELINELLDVSKIRNGKLEYKIAPFEIGSMIENVVNDIQKSNATHTINITGNVNTTFSGDEHRLEQVLINLIGNAIKYSPKADEVLVCAEIVEDTIRIRVRDKGIGISKESLGSLFDKFYRVEDQAVQFQGLGLGLYISHEIVTRHGGHIWAESTKGVGSDFIFTLPIDQG